MKDNNETICHCMGVTRGEIIDAIKKYHLKTTEEVSEKTGASTGCGGCQPDVQAILTEINGVE
jgi:NAD(P)H-nitrite reductase large subunit